MSTLSNKIIKCTLTNIFKKKKIGGNMRTFDFFSCQTSYL
uniref:Uncharacterized protein n=1 Tax=Solanum lycopersicum TaxID=4081 RepID=A0A3Q7HJ35_SOLLC